MVRNNWIRGEIPKNSMDHATSPSSVGRHQVSSSVVKSSREGRHRCLWLSWQTAWASIISTVSRRPRDGDIKILRGTEVCPAEVA